MNELQELVASSGVAYLSDLDFDGFLEHIAHRHPFLGRMIDRTDSHRIETSIDAMNRASWEFEGDADGGRGTAYNVAQRAVGNRGEGMRSLLRLFSETGNDLPGPDRVILDALAGDGTVTRFASTLPIRPRIVSADLSALMIENCLAQGLPCIRQPATESFLRAGVLDGVLIAYGSHHLNAMERRQAAAEAKRTLKPGGRLVLHDFETGGAVDAWFGDVVHPHSITGHPYPHFSRAEMDDLLKSAGFHDVHVFDLSDPFLINGETEDEARTAMLHHLFHMYGLVKLSIDSPAGLDVLARRTAATLGKMALTRSPDGWTARLPRTALVATGTA